MAIGKQIAIALLILLAAALGAYWYGTDPGANGNADAATDRRRAPAVVEVTSVEPARLAQSIEAVGTTRARQAVDIRSAASGQVVEIGFQPGSRVEAGSLLVSLDDAAERADLAEASAELREAELALERAIKLAVNKTISQASVDDQQAIHDAAEARLQRAEKQLRDRTIEAPFAGRIGLKQVDIGARIDGDTVITTLDDLAEIEVEFSVPEIFFGTVAKGQPIKATSVAFGARVFDGLIETVDSRIDSVSRSFRVRAKMPNPDLTLPAGMFMLVDLTVAEREAITVPEEAVVVSDDEVAVFVVTDGKAERRLVTLGQRDFGLVEIIDGLTSGEQIVIKGLPRVRAGAAVEIANPPGDQIEDRQAPAEETPEPSA
ncbi:MAG: efflux RND transporter periplasmic adaptor subunit [Geminicoccaceae bacterium]